MWWCMECPAATNATLPPAQIAQKLTWLSSWHMPIYGQSQNNNNFCLLVISVILSPSMHQ